MWRFSLVLLTSCGPESTMDWSFDVLLERRGDVSPSGFQRASFDEANGPWGEVKVTSGSTARPYSAPAPTATHEEPLSFERLLWLDERHLLLQRLEGCCFSENDVLDLDDGNWTPLLLPSGNYSRTSVEPLSSDLFAVFGSAEGCAELSVARADGTIIRGPLDLGCVRPADVFTSPDGVTVWLTSECDLTATGPFDGCPDEVDARVRQYRWWEDNTLEVLNEDLPRAR